MEATMALTYGVVKCRVVSDPKLKPTRRAHETQYHLHASLRLDAGGGEGGDWDSAINVGTNDADDLLNYKLVFDFHHAGLLAAVRDLKSGFADLTGSAALPALDFLRSDVLAETGAWRESDPMDGSTQVEPVQSLLRLLQRAQKDELD